MPAQGRQCDEPGNLNAAFALFAEFKDDLLNNTLSEEQYDKMSAHSLMQGVSFMQSCTTSAPWSWISAVPV